MRTVNIAELKDRLSTYLNAVREGQEIIVRDRNRPIARILPLSAATAEAEEQLLIAAGELRPPESPLPSSFWSLPAPRVPLKRVAAAVAEERAER